MEVIHNRCLFTDKQLIRLQETPDEVPEGETPYTTSLFAYDDLVDTVRPGDRVEVTGVFSSKGRRISGKQRTVSSVFKTYVNVIHFRKTHIKEDITEEDGEGGMGMEVGRDRADNGDESERGGGANNDRNTGKRFTAERIAEFQAFADR